MQDKNNSKQTEVTSLSPCLKEGQQAWDWTWPGETKQKLAAATWFAIATLDNTKVTFLKLEAGMCILSLRAKHAWMQMQSDATHHSSKVQVVMALEAWPIPFASGPKTGGTERT
jgi:hypothetical protein